jgi:nucleoside-diphosphate-sugar epimerase
MLDHYDRVFVTGGSGFVGRRLIRRLTDGGLEVRALARSESSAQVVADDGAEPVRGDLSDDEALRSGMSGCGLVVHAASKVDEWGAKEAFAETNIRGTERVLEAARDSGVERLVHLGTEAVCATGDPLVDIDESAPYAEFPVSLYAWSKKEAEQVVLAADSDGLEVVVVRPRFVWGAGDRSLLPGVVEAVEDGRFAWLDGGRYRTSTCHVDNAVEGVVRAADRGEPGEVYFVTDGDPVEYRSFVTELLATREVAPPDREMPRWIARSAAVVGEGVWRLFRLDGHPPVTRTATDLLGVEVTIDDGKARRELGYVPVTTRDEGREEMRDEESA